MSLDNLIRNIKETREQEITYQKKCKCENDNNKEVFMYMEGRISAFNDILLQYYYHWEKED